MELTAVTTNFEAQLNFDQLAQLLGGGSSGQVLTATDTGDPDWEDPPAQTYFPPARAYRTAALTLPNGYGSLGCDTLSYDPGGNMHLSGGAYRFVAPVAGYYQVSGQARVTTIATSNLAIVILANAGLVAEGDVNLAVPTGTGQWAGTVTDILGLGAGAVVDVQVFSSPANNTLYVTTALADNRMTVVQVA